MKRLNEDVLLPGDIVLTTAEAFVSQKIRYWTHADISHAMLYVTHCSIIHAVGDGVHAQNTQRILFPDEAPVYALRLKGGLSAEEAERVCNFVREVVGTEYSIFEAAKAISNKWSFASKKQFCSRLVAQAYDRVGYRIVPNPTYCAPAVFLKSDFLKPVENATKILSESEVAYFQSSIDTPGMFMSATNAALKAARKLDRSIQTLSDIGHASMRKPELDEKIAHALQNSRLLDYWNFDREENPWRYDIELMEQENRVEWYCHATMKTESRDNNRFTASLAGLRSDFSRCPRKTLALLVDLYEKLVLLHILRIDTAALWLERHGKD